MSFYSFRTVTSQQPFVGKLADPDEYRRFMDAWRGKERPERPFRVTHKMGGRQRDVIWVGLCPLISNRCKEALSGASGWSDYPVELFGRDGSEIRGYSGLAIVGRTEWIRMNKRNVVSLLDRRGRSVPHWKGLEFDPQTWDGTDIFRAADDETDHVIVTAKVRNALLTHKISNVRLTPIEEATMWAWTER